jgi:hypothetical protein
VNVLSAAAPGPVATRVDAEEVTHAAGVPPGETERIDPVVGGPVYTDAGEDEGANEVAAADAGAVPPGKADGVVGAVDAMDVIPAAEVAGGPVQTDAVEVDAASKDAVDTEKAGIAEAAHQGADETEGGDKVAVVPAHEDAVEVMVGLHDAMDVIPPADVAGSPAHTDAAEVDAAYPNAAENEGAVDTEAVHQDGDESEEGDKVDLVPAHEDAAQVVVGFQNAGNEGPQERVALLAARWRG